MTFIAAVNFSCVDIAATHVDKNKKTNGIAQMGFYCKGIPMNEYEKRTLTNQSFNTNVGQSIFS